MILFLELRAKYPFTDDLNWYQRVRFSAAATCKYSNVSDTRHTSIFNEIEDVHVRLCGRMIQIRADLEQNPN